MPKVIEAFTKKVGEESNTIFPLEKSESLPKEAGMLAKSSHLRRLVGKATSRSSDLPSTSKANKLLKGSI